MPFYTPWTRGTPEERARSVLRWNWRSLGRVGPRQVVVGRRHGGRRRGGRHPGHAGHGLRRLPHGRDRLVARAGAHQGQGIGKEMRAAMLHLASPASDAERANTGAFDDNAASLGVTRALGYRPNGERAHAVEGRRVRELLFALDRADLGADPPRRHRPRRASRPPVPLFGLARRRRAESRSRRPGASG